MHFGIRTLDQQDSYNITDNIFYQNKLKESLKHKQFLVRA